ncbi:hypothetical protein Avbf_01781 [Armadillidium vulgare]|nr:hypothetical protein Avbf_01781 [Armadillidium vulgare]
MVVSSPFPIGITLHIQRVGTSIHKVITFISRENEVSLNSQLEIEINKNKLKGESHVIADLKIIKEDENEAMISSSEGILLTCQMKNDLCTLEVEGNLFADTAGLLGVFDTELNTDFMTSSWERPASVLEWTKSWKIPVDESCVSTSSPNALIFTPKINKDKCYKAFSENESPFRSCSRTVSRRPFEEMCKKDLCSAEEAMKKACQDHYYDVSDIVLICGKFFKFIYVPEAEIVLSSKDTERKLSENDDVQFECRAKGEPSVNKIQFLRDKDLLQSNRSTGILISGNKLTLQSLNPYLLGSYSCRASNKVGSTDSNTVELSFEHKPICDHGEKVLNSSKGEMVMLECKVKANPSDVAFSWSYKSGDEIGQLSSSAVIHSFRSSFLESRLQFVPKYESEIVHVYCWAENEIGSQVDPCEFVINTHHVTSGECEDQYDERRSTENLQHEVVFIGEFSCIDSIAHIIQTLKEESSRQVFCCIIYIINR